jgi:hypothetical protein
MVGHPRSHSLKSPLPFPFALCGLLLLGCGGQREQHTFSLFIEEGVQVVANSGGARFEGDLFTYEHIAQLSQDQQVPESLLYPGDTRQWDEKGFLMDTEGWFYVQDRGNGRVAVFNPSGQYARSIGRRGRGPGEFSFLHMTGIIGDILEIYDEAQHRITFFRTDGELDGTMTSPVGGVRIYFNRADSTLVARSYLREAREDITMVAAGFRTITRDGEPVGQAHTPPIEMSYAYEWAGHKGGVGGADIPFTSNPAMAWTPDRGIFLINGKTPVVWHFGYDGTLVKEIRLDLTAQPVTAEDRRRFARDLERQVEESTGDEQNVLRATLRTLTFAETKSFWKSIMVDDQGYIWLEKASCLDGAESPEETGTAFQILSPEGEFLGSTRAPATGRVMNGHLLAVVADPETGREDHMVWRLVPAVTGFDYSGD